MMLIICFVILTFLSYGNGADPSSVVVIAHRGASGYLPEHTLPSKALAYGQGADYLEQDVVLTRDNVPIVIHDIFLDEVTNVAEEFPGRNRTDGRYYALDFTVAEVKKLRASERFNHLTHKPVYEQRFPLNRSTFHLVTLAEELEFINGLNQATSNNNRSPVGVYVEIKHPEFHARSNRSNFSEIVLDILRQNGYTNRSDRVYLQCFDIEELRRIRSELKSDLKLVGLFTDNTYRSEYSKTDYVYWTSEIGIKEMATFADGIGPHFTELFVQDMTLAPTDLYNYARKYGLFIHPYTFRSDVVPAIFRSFDSMLELFINKLKIDGLFIDQPDKAVAFLQAKKEPPNAGKHLQLSAFLLFFLWTIIVMFQN